MAEPALAARAPQPDPWTTWDRFLETTPAAGFMQSSWWADFRVAAGYEHFGAILRHQSAIIGGAVVMKFCPDDSSCFYYIPEGPVLPRDESAAAEVFEAIFEAVDERRRSEPETVSHLRIEPRWERLPEFVRGFRPVPAFMDPYMEPRDTLCIDLRPSEEAILAQMKPKGRYNIRVALRHGVSVSEDASERGIEDFLSIYGEMTARQRLNAKPVDYFETLIPLLASLGKGSLYFAEYAGIRLAAAIVVYFGDRATYFFGASRDAHRHVMAAHLLHFEIMRRAQAMGCAWYDFWGVAPLSEANHPWQDISVFKRKFGGCEIRLVPTLDHVYDRAAYERYLAAEGDPAARDVAAGGGR